MVVSLVLVCGRSLGAYLLIAITLTGLLLNAFLLSGLLLATLVYILS